MTGTVPAPLAWAVRGLFAIALIFAMREARALLVPIALALVLTFVLAPAVRWLRRRGIPEVVGAGLLLLLLLGSLVPLAASLAEPAAQWREKAPTTLAQLFAQFDRMRAAIPGLGPPPTPDPPRPASARGAARAAAAAASAPPPADPVKDRLASEGVALTGALLGHGVEFAVSATVTVILLYFLLASEHWILSRCVEALPRRRARALLLGGARASQREIGRYLFAVGCINLGLGALSGLAMWLLGLPNPLLWAVLVTALNFVPYLGPAMIIGLLLLAGMASFGELSAMLAPAGAFALLHAIESNLFSPWMVGRRLVLSPLAVFVAVMFWGWLWGMAGALIAVPMLIAMRSFFKRHRRLRQLARFLEGDYNAPPPLRALLRPRGRLAPRTARRGPAEARDKP